jgi:hypothetical protein
MASQKLRERISEIISNPLNVDFEDIEKILVTELGNKSPRKTKHGYLFNIKGCSQPLMLNKHNNGKPKLPRYCVMQFRDRMIELSYYEPPSNDEKY